MLLRRDSVSWKRFIQKLSAQDPGLCENLVSRISETQAHQEGDSQASESSMHSSMNFSADMTMRQEKGILYS